MKKTLLTIGLMTAISASAQTTTVSFEDIILATETYYNGSDGEGEFVSNGVTFPNEYTGYWSGGWACSNTTDVTTAGYLNESSAYAGSGAGSSANYAVAYGGSIDFGTTSVVVGSADFTNTTYAALSMLNGDAYGKVFGSPNSALGQPDGTNGADWFRLLVIASDQEGAAIDTVAFYLADYRFANNTQDYIVDSWETVDLSSLGELRYLDFKLQSSDVGSFGMNTPAYFAMDNLRFGTVGLQEHAVAAFTLYPNPAKTNVTIKGQAGMLKVFSTTGALVYNGTTSGMTALSIENWNNGFYIVELTNETGVTRSTLVKN